MINFITSIINPLIKLTKSLHSSKGRKEHKLFIAEGIRTCLTFIENKWEPAHMLIGQSQHELQNSDIHKFIEKIKPETYTIVTDQIMNEISTATTPSGMLCIFTIPQLTVIDKSLSDSIILYEISEPGNMGAIIRTAAAFGIKKIYTVNGCDPFSPKVIQASAGTISFIKIIKTTWDHILKIKNNSMLCALVTKNGIPIQKLDHTTNHILVLGNEAHGIPENILADTDIHTTITMPGNTESLNASIAFAIALYELQKPN